MGFVCPLLVCWDTARRCLMVARALFGLYIVAVHAWLAFVYLSWVGLVGLSQVRVADEVSPTLPPGVFRPVARLAL